MSVFERNKVLSLDTVYALQLIREYVKGSESNYYSYELNLVLRDGQRLNVVDHGDGRRLRRDAERLAQFLGVRVWDGSEPPEMVSPHGDS